MGIDHALLEGGGSLSVFDGRKLTSVVQAGSLKEAGPVEGKSTIAEKKVPPKDKEPEKYKPDTIRKDYETIRKLINNRDNPIQKSPPFLLTNVKSVEDTCIGGLSC